MNITKLLLATLASMVVMLGLGYLWHEVIMMDQYAEWSHAPEGWTTNIKYVAIGYLMLAGLMSYVYPYGYKGGSKIMEGFKFGAIMGMIWVLPHALIEVGSEYAPRMAVVYEAWHILEQGIGGMIIGLIYGKSTS
ncbi:MAG: hypothetical protein IIA45_13805 [Bacteroidetes bacterium]|nr:hypothetical protein [Bacteroidota bacterium]